MNFTKISEWVKAGCFKTGFFMVEKVVGETEKAYAFEGIKYNSFGNSYKCKNWISKKMVVEVENDFYDKCENKVFLIKSNIYNNYNW